MSKSKLEVATNALLAIQKIAYHQSVIDIVDAALAELDHSTTPACDETCRNYPAGWHAPRCPGKS